MKKKVIVSGLFLIMLFCVASVANASIMTSDYINDYYARLMLIQAAIWIFLLMYKLPILWIN